MIVEDIASESKSRPHLIGWKTNELRTARRIRLKSLDCSSLGQAVFLVGVRVKYAVMTNPSVADHFLVYYNKKSYAAERFMHERILDTSAEPIRVST